MDGVLCDFEGGVDRHVPGLPWKDLNRSRSHLPKELILLKDRMYDYVINHSPEFWINLDWMPNAWSMFCYVQRTFKHVGIITAPLTGDSMCPDGKREWIKRNLFGIQEIVVTKDKEKYVGIIPGDVQVLIDDRQDNIEKWIEAGGVGILHEDPEDTVYHLESLITGTLQNQDVVRH
jgi:hypothetical protein